MEEGRDGSLMASLVSSNRASCCDNSAEQTCACVGFAQRRYDMRHEILTQRALFCHRANTKTGTLSQHFVTHVVPPLGFAIAIIVGYQKRQPYSVCILKLIFFSPWGSGGQFWYLV